MDIKHQVVRFEAGILAQCANESALVVYNDYPSSKGRNRELASTVNRRNFDRRVRPIGLKIFVYIGRE